MATNEMLNAYSACLDQGLIYSRLGVNLILESTYWASGYFWFGRFYAIVSQSSLGREVNLRKLEAKLFISSTLHKQYLTLEVNLSEQYFVKQRA